LKQDVTTMLLGHDMISEQFVPGWAWDLAADNKNVTRM
jgi:hypothetical protein